MKVVFRDSAKEIPMPGRARDIPRFLRELWAWEVKFFWLLAIDLESLLLLYLWEKMPALQKFKRVESRLLNLIDGVIFLRDETDCEIHYGFEARFLDRLPKGFWKLMRRIRNFIWGWSLLGEGYMWQYINVHFIRNEGLQEKISCRSLSVSVTGANLLTDGWAFPGIETHGAAPRKAGRDEKTGEDTNGQHDR